MENRIKNAVFLIAVLVSFQGMFLFSVEKASAGRVNFGQKILPIEMVYVKKNGEIGKVWSNVSQKDDAYVLKFIGSDGKTEIDPKFDIVMDFVKIKEGKKDFFKSSEKNVKIIFENGKIEQVETVS